MITIIIPSYNSQATIEKCINALYNQTYKGDFEVILADSSEDQTQNIVKEKFPQVKLIPFKTKTDPGTARNAAIRQSKGDLILMIDSDCVANPDWMELMVETHQNDEYSAVGGSVLNGNDPKCEVAWAGYIAEFREFLPGFKPELREHIPTCNISYKRWVLRQYGLFQDILPDWITIKHPQQGDLIFNYNLFKNGEKILFDPEIQVAHINMPTITRFLGHQFRLGRITSLVLKHFPSLHGAFIARSRVITLFAAPMLPVVKFFNTFRVATLSKEYMRPFFLITPLLFTGLLFWDIGFIRGAFLPKKFPLR
jgi:glycosyltransferase involved in cell wall biosynthesis